MAVAVRENDDGQGSHLKEGFAGAHYPGTRKRASSWILLSFMVDHA